MAYIICEPCVDTVDWACAGACPVDCIYVHDDLHDGCGHPDWDEKSDLPKNGDIAFIHPEECIDCGACVDPCPVNAIYEADEVPEEWEEYTAINAKAFGL